MSGISHPLTGITMRYRTGQSHDMSVDTICDTGIIQIREDSDSPRRAISKERDGRIVTHSHDTISEREHQRKSSQKQRRDSNISSSLSVHSHSKHRSSLYRGYKNSKEKVLSLSMMERYISLRLEFLEKIL